MSRLDTRRFKILSLIGKRSGVAFEPLEDISWVGAWWAAGPEFRALGLAHGAAVTTFPDEVGTADMTRDAAGPTFTTSSSALAGRPAVITDGLTVLRTAAASISVSLPYSVFWVGRATATTDIKVYVGGAASADTIAPMAAVISCISLFGLVEGSGSPLTTTQRIWTAVATSSTSDKIRVAGTTYTKNQGNGLLTRIALGGYADFPSMTTETYFLGVYQGDLTLHPRFADLEAWAAAS